MADTRLIYLMDPMCSWCWGFEPVISALIAQAAAAGVPTHWLAGGLRSEQNPIDSAARVRYLGYWQAVNATTGQLFDFAKGLPEGMSYNTEPACRALVTARTLDPDTVQSLVRRIQQAFYREGQDVTCAALLRQLAGAVGLSESAFAELFDSPQLRIATAEDARWAQNLGISGFPTVLAQSPEGLALLTNGYQSLSELEPLLAHWLEHQRHG